MASSNFSSILFTLVILLMNTTLALSDTNLSKNHPNLKTISKQAADNVNAGETSNGLEHIWCVAKNNAQDADLQAAIDWACGQGGVDCEPIQQNRACYDPTNLQSTATYVFNDYYQRNGRTDESCNFSGTAALSSLDPSHGDCKLQFSTLVVARDTIIGNSNSRSNAEIVSKWNGATVATLFILTYSLIGIFII